MLILMLALHPVMAEAEEIQQTEETQESPGEQTASENQVAAEVAAPHALLMEVSTGTVLMGKAADEKIHPASVTKIMTMLLILEAIEDGKIALSDTVTVSEHAASMGGSQVYLEPFEQQTVETMIKCIAVVAYWNGSEKVFLFRLMLTLMNLHCFRFSAPALFFHMVQLFMFGD